MSESQNPRIQQAVEAVRQQLAAMQALKLSYNGEQVHPINASILLRDFTNIRLNEDEMQEFWQEWEKAGRR